MHTTCHALGRCGAWLRDIVSGASGLATYEQYLAHQRAHHPDVIPMSSAAFFRAEQAARWEGVRRCC
jgi:uncharacterized short protein YbdD (DUF466 family)